MSLGPEITDGVLCVSLCDASGATVASGERSLETVLTEDVDRAELELRDEGGYTAGSMDLVRSSCLSIEIFGSHRSRL